jgi:tripartite-type tricarboxylate transporter receptor subunit TctC
MRVGLTLALALCSAAVGATEFPARPITIIVPYPPGGTADLLPRLIAERLPDVLKVPVIVQNKPGASGTLGADLVSRAAPDGYTLLGVPPHFFVSDLLYKIWFDPKAFEPVGIIASYPNVLLANSNLPVANVKDLIALTSSGKKTLNMASAGAGTSQHLSAELLKIKAHVDYTHVPYKGTAPALSDLMGGHVDAMFDNLITALPYVQSGKVKLLGVGSAKRNPAFPDTPAISEVVPGYESVTWMGLVAPPATPVAVVERLSQAVAQVLKDPKLRAQIEAMQAAPADGMRADMQKQVKEDTARWSDVIRTARIVAE